MWTICKALMNLLQYCFYFVFCHCFFFFGPEACGTPASRPEIEPAPFALEGELLTTGPPGSPLIYFLQ